MELKDLFNDDDQWYQYNHTDIKVKIKHPTKKELDHLTKKNTRKKRRGGTTEKILDEKQLDLDTLHFCVLDWANMTHEGKEFPCTPENREKANESTRFSTFWNSIIVDGMEADYTEAEDVKGN